MTTSGPINCSLSVGALTEREPTATATRPLNEVSLLAFKWRAMAAEDESKLGNALQDVSNCMLSYIRLSIPNVASSHFIDRLQSEFPSA